MLTEEQTGSGKDIPKDGETHRRTKRHYEVNSRFWLCERELCEFSISLLVAPFCYI